MQMKDIKKMKIIKLGKKYNRNSFKNNLAKHN